MTCCSQRQSLICRPACRSAIPQRRAFTLIELLIVIAILGILQSICLPAIQVVRAAARSMQCRSNLRQIGVATRIYAETFRGQMPFHVAEGDMTSKSQSAIQALMPYCENNPQMFACPDDIGSFEDSTPFWESFGTSYKFEGRAFSEPAQPQTTVQEFDSKTGTWKNKVKKAKPEVVRNLKQHEIGLDVKKVIEGKAQEDQPGGTTKIQLARDLLEPWKQGEVKSSQIRGVYTMRGYHSPSHLNAVFLDGHVATFGEKAEWELARGKTGGGDD